MAISSPGIGSNLDVNGIITKLMQVESQPLTDLDTREASYQAKLTAYGTLKGALSSFQTAVQGLNDPAKFQSLKASSTDSTIINASATSIASAGSYAINVSKIAQSQSLVAVGQSNATSAIGTGAATTLTFDFGTVSGGTFTAYNPATGAGGTYAGSTFTSNGNGVKTVTIDATNNSLSGIRDAINKANIGVTASIINDGGTSPYRLVLSSNTAGVANSLKITATGDASVSALLSQDPAGAQNLQETVTAQNTEATVNGVFVSKSSSTLTDVVQGVTLNVLKVGATTVNVAQDSSGATASVTSFVKAYNDLNKTLKDLSSYDPATKKSAVLQGDAAVRTIQSQIRGLLSHALTGGGSYKTLSELGITFQGNGSLTFDSSKLQSALSTNARDVAAVFVALGSATDSLVSYSGSTANTQPGSYSLNVSQLATQGKLAGSAAAGLTITAGVNDTLNVTVDGVNTAVTLAAKTYTTATQLAMEVQSKINGATALSSVGSSVAVQQTAGALTIVSNKYGSASNVTVGGNGAANLLGATPAATAGVDVAGTLNGSAATGLGQYLTGGSGSGATGLKIQITGGITGARGLVKFSQGYAFQLNKLVDSLSGSSGPIASMTDGVNRTIKDIGNRRDVLNRRLASLETRYRAQFTALDTLISSMNQTSTYLTQQLANLPKTSA